MSPSPAPDRSAAFFDVDGTLADTNVVHYYVYFRRRQMSPIVGHLWQVAYLIKCLYYLVVDRIDRRIFNTIFYRGYTGQDAAALRMLAPDCHRDVTKPRQFRQGSDCIEAHRGAGRRIVLVTGSIDFIVAPLAGELGADDVLAPALVEVDGRFTGSLDGPPVADREKARRVQQLAKEHDIDLSQSYAYGDSIADLPMLEAVGHPQAVNPDKALGKIAATRGWPIHRWTIASQPEATVT